MKPRSGRAARAVTAAILALTFIVGVSAEPLTAQAGQEPEAREGPPPGWRKWALAGAGGLVFGLPAFTAESLPKEIGGCNTSSCFGTLATVVGATIGFLIGHELDETAARKAAVGPTLERVTDRVELPLLPSRLVTHPGGTLVLGRDGFAAVSSDLAVQRIGRNLRGITAATVLPGKDAILASTAAGLFAFDMAGTERNGRLVHQQGGRALESISSEDVVLGDSEFLRRLRLTGRGVALELSETARADQRGVFTDVVWAPYGNVIWTLSRDRLVSRSPSDLGEIATLRLPGELRTLAVSGDVGIATAGRHGVFLLDLADPASPEVTGRIEGMSFAFDAALVGTEAFIAAGDEGLLVVDVSDPTNVEVTGVLRELGLVNAVQRQGDRVYVLDRRGRTLHVLEAGGEAASGEG